MTELVFRGTFDTNKSQDFLDGLATLLKETETEFRGQMLQFDVLDYTEYEEIKNEEMSEQTTESNVESSDNGPDEGQRN